MVNNLLFLLVIAAATVTEVYSCNAKHQFNSGTPAPKPSFLQSLKDAGKLQENNSQNNKEPNKPDDGKTVTLYGKAQEHEHQTFYQHPYRNDGKGGGAEKGLADILFQNDQNNGYKSGSSFQYNSGNDIKNPNFSGGGNLFKTPLANDYKKGPGFQVQDGIFKENQPGTQFKNAFPTEYTNKENDFNGENSKGNGGSQFGYNKAQGPTGFPITNGDNGNKGPRPLIQLPITTQQTPEIFKAIDLSNFLPKPEAQKQELIENNHANNGHIKNIADRLNFNHFNLFNSPSQSFDGGNNNLDFNDNSQNYNGHFNNFNEQSGNNAQNSNHQQSQAQVPLTGFYNINDPSGSWRNIDYNAGPTGFYANVQQSTNHDGHGTSYGDFKTFGSIQNFGL